MPTGFIPNTTHRPIFKRRNGQKGVTCLHTEYIQDENTHLREKQRMNGLMTVIITGQNIGLGMHPTFT